MTATRTAIFDSTSADSITAAAVIVNKYINTDLVDIGGKNETEVDALISAVSSSQDAIYTLVKTGNANTVVAVEGTAELQVTAYGSIRERITTVVTSGTDVVTIGSITSTNTSIEDDVDDMVASINEGTDFHGFTAVKKPTTTDTILVTAPTGSGAAANAYVLSYTVEANHAAAATATGTDWADLATGVDEVLGTAVVTLTAGAAGEIGYVEVDDGGAVPVVIGAYETAAGTDEADALLLKASINEGTIKHGFTADNLLGVVTIYAPVGTGASANSFVCTSHVDTGGTLAIAITSDFAATATGVDETRATATITSTTAGIDNNLISVLVDDGAAEFCIGTYLVVNGSTTTDAAGIAAAINDGTSYHGFSATSALAEVTVTAPIGLGTAANAYVTTILTDTLTTFVGTTTGTDFADLATGVTGVAFVDGQMNVGQGSTLAAKATSGSLTDYYTSGGKNTCYRTWEGLHPSIVPPKVVTMLGGYNVVSSDATYLSVLNAVLPIMMSDVDGEYGSWKRLIHNSDSTLSVTNYVPVQDIDFLELLNGRKIAKEMDKSS